MTVVFLQLSQYNKKRITKILQKSLHIILQKHMKINQLTGINLFGSPCSRYGAQF